MKVPAGFHPSLGEWVEAFGSESLRRDYVIDLLRDDLICEGIEDFKSAVEKATSSKWRSRLLDLKKYISWKVVNASDLENVLDATLPEEIQSEVLERIRLQKNSARAHIRAGEPRDESFNRTLKPLAQRANRIEIFDQYAAKNINLRSDSATWFIKRILSANSDVTLVFYTQETIQNNEDQLKQGASNPQRIERIRASLGSILQDMHKFRGTVRVIHAGSKIEMHDRVFSFRFDEGETEVNVGKGIDAFDKAISPEPRSLSLGDYEHVKQLRQLFAASSYPGGDVVVTHADFCSSCSS